MSASPVTIGTGSASPNDRLQPALDLAYSGLVEYLISDRLGGAMVSHHELERRGNQNAGFDPHLREIAASMSGYLSSGNGHLIGSYGGSNVPGAVAASVSGLRDAGGKSVRVGAIHGDNVYDAVLAHNIELPTLGLRARDLGDKLLTAHAYIGAEPVTECLGKGAKLVIAGRICDASLAVGVVGYAFDSIGGDWDAIASATLLGHLLTGGAGVTGGGSADPPYRVVPGIENLGFGYATVNRNDFALQKLATSGGTITRNILKCRISYEMEDPASYPTPDVVGDFSQTGVEQLGPDHVRVFGTSGRARPDELLIILGVDRGWIGISECSFGGPGCVDRARVGEEMARKQLEPYMDQVSDLRFEYIGINSLHDGQVASACEPAEVRLRIAARSESEEVARFASRLSYRVYWGPAGCGAMRAEVRKSIESTGGFLHRDLVTIETEIIDS